MTESKNNYPGDRSLGMNSEITRRDFLGSSLLASGSLLCSGMSPTEFLAAHPGYALPGSAEDWTGYGGVGEYAHSNGNTWEVLTAGHNMRDGAYDPAKNPVVETGEIYDCVVVGGGISGLAAALQFRRQAGPKATCLVLENHPIFGGEAKQNEFDVDGKRVFAHQGSAIYFAQYPRSFLAKFYDSIGLKEPRLNYQTWGGPGPEMTIGKTPYDSAGLATGQYGFWFGAKFAGSESGMWQIDPVGKKFADISLPDDRKKELIRWYCGEAEQHSSFTPPQYEGDPVSRALDSVTLEEHYMQRFGISREFIRTFLSPDLGGGSGLGADALSAFSEYSAGLLHPFHSEPEAVQMFPGGNTAIARLIAKTLIPDSISGPATPEGVTLGKVDFTRLDVTGSPARIRLSSTAVAVNHIGSPEKSQFVSVCYQKEGRLFRVKAKTAVVAGGSWTAKHILPDLPQSHRDAYAQFYRSPCMMANVAIRNWKFLQKMGITGCHWFGEGIGSYFEIRRMALVGAIDPKISPEAPVVLTIKVLYPSPGLSTEQQGQRGRGEMLVTSFREYERRIRMQLDTMFRHAGFDAQRDIAGIILNRWGHAYLSPQPGFFFGKDGKPAPRETLRSAPFGRIAFANSDLAGTMDHRCSILEAERAVSQLMEQVYE